MKKYILALLLGSPSLLIAGSTMSIPSEPMIQIPEILEEEKDFYVGFGVSYGKLNTHFYEGKSTDLTLKAGYDFSPYFGLEVRASTGIHEFDELSHEYSYGFYIKPQYPITEELNIYALLGYGRSKLILEDAAESILNNYTVQDGFSYGVGIEYQLDPHYSLFIDAMRLIDESVVQDERPYAIKVDSFAIGINYRF